MIGLLLLINWIECDRSSFAMIAISLRIDDDLVALQKFKAFKVENE